MRRIALLSIVLAMLFGMAGNSWAQTATGQIMGTLKDASGGTLASASSNVGRTGTTFNMTLNTVPDVYYHTVASITATFAQTGTC